VIPHLRYAFEMLEDLEACTPETSGAVTAPSDLPTE
jgi:hypothetical protein